MPSDSEHNRRAQWPVLGLILKNEGLCVYSLPKSLLASMAARGHSFEPRDSVIVKYTQISKTIQKM